MLKRKTVIHILTVMACLCLALSCLFALPKNKVAVAESSLLTVGTDWTTGTTTEATISDSVSSVYTAAGFVSGGHYSAADKNKTVLNNFSRGVATVITFTTPIDLTQYSSVTFEIAKGISASTTFDFYKDDASTVIGETASGYTAVVTAATNVFQSFTMGLSPFAKDGKVSSFIFVHTTDARPAPANPTENDGVNGDYLIIQAQLAKITLNPLDLTVSRDWTVTATTSATLGSSVTSAYPNATISAGGAGSSYFTGTPSGGSYESKYFLKNFTRGCATVIKFTNAIDVSVYESLTLSLYKNIGASATFDFYKDDASTVIGETASAFTAVVTSGTYSGGSNRPMQKFTFDLEPFAKDGKVSSIIIVHTTDARAEGDFESFEAGIVNLILNPLIPAADHVLSTASSDISFAAINSTEGLLGSVSGGYSSNVKGIYANSVQEHAGFKLNFATPIDVKDYAQLNLPIKVNGWSTGTTSYSHYIDLFKVDATKIHHANAVASYNVLHANTTELIINLADFADKYGMVSGIILYHYDTSRNDGVQLTKFPAIHVFDAKVLVEANTNVSKAKNETIILPALPDKKDSKEVLVGWQVGDKLLAPSSSWAVTDENSSEIETATPVYAKFYMEDGASIRLGAPAGLRFTTTIDNASYEMLTNNATLTFGTTIKTSGSMVELEIRRETSWLSKTDNDEKFVSHSFNAAMTGIQEKYYETEFIGTGWVEISYSDAKVMRIYACQGDNLRSVKGVAIKALNDQDATYTDKHIEILNKFAGINA